ncbi:MAG: transcriptional regulator [Proteobacteria bacterium]|nr:transcriptional regulator [Pseudomonadota bacterium]
MSRDPLPELDLVLHPPARLQIASVLSKVNEVEFERLRAIARISDSVLSKHLSALVEAGYVDLRRGARDGRARGWASLTKQGDRALKNHVAALHAIIAGTLPDHPSQVP